MSAEVTADLIHSVMPHASVERYAAPLAASMGRHGITGQLRCAHFLAQVAVESGELTYAEELGSGAAYEGRRDLGNTEPGDGARFKGRGLLQITGRYNYAALGKAVGRDLLTDAGAATVATDPALAVEAATWFWSTHNLNALADRDDVEALTRAINGGLNALDRRKAYLSRALALLRFADARAAVQSTGTAAATKTNPATPPASAIITSAPVTSL